MLQGILIGLLISLPIFAIVCVLIYENTYNEIISLGCAIIISLLFILIGEKIGIYLDQTEYEKQINTYIITKQTIEDTIQNKNISDLEKIELLKQVNEQNQKLEELKVEVRQWYNFYLDESKIENLEPIKLK